MLGACEPPARDLAGAHRSGRAPGDQLARAPTEVAVDEAAARRERSGIALGVGLQSRRERERPEPVVRAGLVDPGQEVELGRRGRVRGPRPDDGERRSEGEKGE